MRPREIPANRREERPALAFAITPGPDPPPRKRAERCRPDRGPAV